jgi:O-antigen ligase
MSSLLGSSYKPYEAKTINIWLLCFIAVSPSLGTAVAAVGRLLLYLLALAYLVYRARDRTKSSPLAHAAGLSAMILLSCAYMATAVTWSSVPMEAALIAWTRHARLVTIPIMCTLIASRTEGLTVLRAFTFAQIFVVLSAWLLVLGIHLPWATGQHADDTYAVFGSYLEQSITQSVLVAILWFQRDTLFGKSGRWIAITLALVTLVLTLGFLRGRSGHMVALGMVTLAGMHAIPRKFRWTALAIPFVAFTLVMVGSQNFRDRMMQVVSEVGAYSQTRATDSSSGERLVYWSTSLKAIAEKPLLGHGAGSWNFEYRKLGGDKLAPPTTDNPHQMFLLWAVEGGLVGVALLISVLWSLLFFSKKLEAQDAQTLQALVLGLVISGMFNSMIFGIGIGDFFCIGFGIILSLHKKAAPAASPTQHEYQA